jgi:hypothetical protein
MACYWTDIIASLKQKGGVQHAPNVILTNGDIAQVYAPRLSLNASDRDLHHLENSYSSSLPNPAPTSFSAMTPAPALFEAAGSSQTAGVPTSIR